MCLDVKMVQSRNYAVRTRSKELLVGCAFMLGLSVSVVLSQVGLLQHFEMYRVSFEAPTTSTSRKTTSTTTISTTRIYDTKKKNILTLPIAPTLNITSSILLESSALKDFFTTYPKPTLGGWIDVNELAFTSVKELRRIATNIMDRDMQCGCPKVNSTMMMEKEANNIKRSMIPESNDFEYCMWKADLVSDEALDNFSFERSHWEWIVHQFSNLYYNQSFTGRGSSSNSDVMNECQQLGFLDVGVNIGDWISPLRLLAPRVPIYGVEGSPATAALATANIRTSVEYHKMKTTIVKNKNENDDVITSRIAPSMILPFSLASIPQVPGIYENGGVCFSEPEYVKHLRRNNIGSRYVVTSTTDDHNNNTKIDCREADAAGATTLEHALKAIVQNQNQRKQGCRNNNNNNNLEWPRIYIAKFDIEGHEYKAISSVVSWLIQQPPCYVMVEYRNEPSYVALIELFSDVIGYDSIWRPKKMEYPSYTEPWWNSDRNPDNLQRKLKRYSKARHTELIFGFSDLNSCLSRL